MKLLKQDKAYNLQLLQEQYQIGPAQIEALYHFAKNKFECGNYTDAAEFLYHYRYLTPLPHIHYLAKCWFYPFQRVNIMFCLVGR